MGKARATDTVRELSKMGLGSELRFEGPTVVPIKITVLWDVPPRGLLDKSKKSGKTFCPLP